MKLFTRLYRYIFYYRWNFALFLVLFAAGTVAQNFQPFLLRGITTAVTSHNFTLAAQLTVGLGIALGLATLLHTLSFFVGDQGMTKTSADIQHDVMKHIHTLDFAFHANKSSGKLISLMKRGDDAYFNFYDVLNRDVVGLLISFVIMLVAFTQLNVKYLLWSFGIVVLALVCAGPLLRRNMKARKVFLIADDLVAARRADNLLNFDTVKYFAKEAYEQTMFKQLLLDWYNKAQKFFFTFRYFDLIIGNLSNIAIAGIIGLAVFDLWSGSIQFADFVLVASFAAAFFPQLMSLLFSLRILTKNYSDLSAYLEVLDEQPQVKDPIHPRRIPRVQGAIHFQDVSFHYPESNPVLKHFELSIAPGESVAFVGYSGAGKTTLAKLLLRMYDPSSGQITLDGVPLPEMRKTELRAQLGLVPQDPLMFNSSIEYNLRYAKPDASSQELERVIKQAKLAEFVDRLPAKLQTVVGERGIKLSGGQRQRLAIARVLLATPAVIIFDEATSALDSESERDIQAAFWALAKESGRTRTSIIIAHRLSTVMRADRIIVLNQGKIVEQGTHRELLQKTGGIYQSLWKLQQDGFLGDGEYVGENTTTLSATLA